MNWFDRWYGGKTMNVVVRRFACWLDREIEREAANWFEGLSAGKMVGKPDGLQDG